MKDHTALTALVVHESMFGNSASIAESVARGLEIGGFTETHVDVGRAPDLDGVQGPLVSGENVRADAWGLKVARACEVRALSPAARST